MLRYIIFAPLAGAAINWLVGRQLLKRERVNEPLLGGIACAAVAVACVLAFYEAFRSGGALHIGEAGNNLTPVFDHLWTWIQVGRFRADFGLAMDRLSGIYVCFITFVGLLIHLFAIGYMHGDRSFYRFFSYLNLFMFMMLTLVLADNLLLMFVGWEGVGLCSYLLIGYYIDRREASDAAKKAFIANRVGDWGVILGIMLIFVLTSNAGAPSISFFDKPELGVVSALKTIAAMNVDPFTWHALIAGGITSAALLLFIGATGKSAQIPLYVWLPDAMAGPTPVSALIHAATMVTAGVYMVVRCSAIYSHAPTVMFIVAIIGAATAIFAATIGLAQNDIKKVLAYSTVSQLGYMFLACGVGAFVAAIFHVMTHAFFKALLFLGSGSVITGMHHEQDMRRMGGLRKYMPITFFTMMAGWLAICGIVPFAGFFSKDEILWKTWSTAALAIPQGAGKALWFVGAVTAALTAIYMTRLMIMTFWGAERFQETHAGGQADDAHAAAYDERHTTHDAQEPSAAVGHMDEGYDRNAPTLTMDVTALNTAREQHAQHAPLHPHESPWVMTVPLVVLAVLATVGGLVGIPYALGSLVGGVPNYFERTLEPAVAKAPEPGGAAGHEGAATGQAEPPRMLSRPPQQVDGAAPLSVGEGRQGEATTERAPSAEDTSRERLFTVISLLIAGGGIAIGFLIFLKRPLLEFPRLLENKYYVDELYDAAIINPIKVGSRQGLWRFFDVRVIDGLVNGLGRATREVGDVVRRVQFGFVRSYAAIILLGALAVIGYFIYAAAPHLLR